MLKIKRWLEVFASLKILQDPIEQFRMTAVCAGRSMKVHQLTPVRSQGKKSVRRMTWRPIAFMELTLSSN